MNSRLLGNSALNVIFISSAAFLVGLGLAIAVQLKSSTQKKQKKKRPAKKERPQEKTWLPRTESFLRSRIRQFLTDEENESLRVSQSFECEKHSPKRKRVFKKINSAFFSDVDQLPTVLKEEEGLDKLYFAVVNKFGS